MQDSEHYISMGDEVDKAPEWLIGHGCTAAVVGAAGSRYAGVVFTQPPLTGMLPGSVAHLAVPGQTLVYEETKHGGLVSVR